IELPNVHAVRAIADYILVFYQPVCERCFAYCSFSDQHNFGVHITPICCGCRRSRQGQFEDIDGAAGSAYHEARAIATESNGSREVLTKSDHAEQCSLLPIPDSRA